MFPVVGFAYCLPLFTPCGLLYVSFMPPPGGGGKKTKPVQVAEDGGPSEVVTSETMTGESVQPASGLVCSIGLGGVPPTEGAAHRSIHMS